MSEASTLDRDLAVLGHRFIIETSEFLSANRDAQRDWWPRRHTARGGAPVTCCVAGVDCGTDAPAESLEVPLAEPLAEPLAPPQEVLRAVHVISLHPDGPEFDGTGLDDTHVFILASSSRWADLVAARIRSVLLHSPPPDDDGEWLIWVPDTVTLSPSVAAEQERQSFRWQILHTPPVCTGAQCA